MTLNCARGDSAWKLGKKLFSERASEKEAQAAQGDSGVTVPENYQETCRWGTERHG